MPLGKDTDRMGNAREPWKRLGFMGPDMGRINPMESRQRSMVKRAMENDPIKASGPVEEHPWGLERTEQNPQIQGQLSFWRDPHNFGKVEDDHYYDLPELATSRDHAEETASGPGPLPVRAFAEDWVRHETEGGGEDSQEEQDRRWGLAAQMGIEGTEYNHPDYIPEGPHHRSRGHTVSKYSGGPRYHG